MAEVVTPEAAFARGITELRRLTGLPVVMGGLVTSEQHFTITELRGARTSSLANLRVRHGEGLGGKTLASRRPAAVRAYPHSRSITHRYDRWVAPEGLQSVASIPVGLPGRAPSAIVYLCERRDEPLGPAVIDAVRPALTRLAVDLSAAFTVQEQLSAMAARASAPELEHGDLLRELRDVARLTTDPSTRRQLETVLARLHGGAGAEAVATPRRSPLTPREQEVLRLIEQGATNLEIAERLGLVENTVKSYVKTAMAKLGADNRYKAALLARTEGWLH